MQANTHTCIYMHTHIITHNISTYMEEYNTMLFNYQKYIRFCCVIIFENKSIVICFINLLLFAFKFV